MVLRPYQQLAQAKALIDELRHEITVLHADSKIQSKRLFARESQVNRLRSVINNIHDLSYNPQCTNGKLP